MTRYMHGHQTPLSFSIEECGALVKASLEDHPARAMIRDVHQTLKWAIPVNRCTPPRKSKLTRDTHQCRNILAQPVIQYAASLVLVHWNRNGISRACDLTAVFTIDHAPVELHSNWLHAAKPGLCLLFTC